MRRFLCSFFLDYFTTFAYRYTISRERLGYRRSQMGGAGGPDPPIKMLPMIKKVTKKLLFLQFQFLLASSRTTVINNNNDLGGLGPLNLIFINQFKWAPNNNIDPGDQGPFNLIFAN